MGVLVLVMGCSSSAKFSSASGGSAGKSGSGGSSSGGSSGAGGGAAGNPSGGAAGSGTGGVGQGGAVGVDAGPPCGANATCPGGFYCQGCSGGTCQPIPTTPLGGFSPVCGCDGVSYWNAMLAINSGVAVQSQGGCSVGQATPCVQGTCHNGATCNKKRSDKLCAATVDVGDCWMVPNDCPTTGPRGIACGDGTNTCVLRCNLIQDGTPWYPGGCTSN